MTISDSDPSNLVLPPSGPRLFLTSMCGPGEVNNIIEMVEPILPHLDGIIWVLHDCPTHDPGARYLESVKGAGRIIHRPWPRGRHWHSMNDTLFSGGAEEGDLMIWTDLLEHPKAPFLSRIKTEIEPMMREADVDLIAYFGKPFLFRYRETLEYRNSPHWSLHGWNNRGIEWSNMEPDETKVRQNMRPIKRKDEPNHWVGHYLKYFLSYPAGSNHAALGIDQFAAPGESVEQAFQRRESNRLAFRHEMKKRGYPLTVAGFVDMCKAGLDEDLKKWLNSDKVFSDAYHWLVRGDRSGIKDTHNPKDAVLVS